MSLNMTLTVHLDQELFMLEELQEAKRLAETSKKAVYSWKTTGRSNWLERGSSIVDVLGYVFLPQGLPSVIEMPDDPRE